MRLFLLALGLMLIGVWLNIVFNNYVQLGGLKINWLLMFMLILTFRHSKLLIAFVGMLAGLMMDALSHGIIGLYGTSFFLTLLLISQVSKLFYANTFLAVSLAVFSMSIFEGWISLSIIDMFEPGLELSTNLLTSTLPVAISAGINDTYNSSICNLGRKTFPEGCCVKLDTLEFEELDRIRIRLIILGGVVILIFSLLASRLWYLQITEGQKYTEFSQGNRVRLVPEPALRGIIYDRNGVILAENRPAYQLQLIREDTPDLESTLGKVSQALNLSFARNE